MLLGVRLLTTIYDITIEGNVMVDLPFVETVMEGVNIFSDF